MRHSIVNIGTNVEHDQIEDLQNMKQSVFKKFNDVTVVGAETKNSADARFVICLVSIQYWKWQPDDI